MTSVVEALRRSTTNTMPPLASSSATPHAWSVWTFFAQLCGYVALSTVLEYVFFYRRWTERRKWRTQPSNETRSCHASTNTGGYDWGLPARDLWCVTPRRGRHRMHSTYATVNLLVSALFAGATCEAYIRGLTNLSQGGVFLETAFGLANLIAVQSVLEYYWHRVMHVPAVYKQLHKLHHHYKSPVVWDDLFIHPCEAFGYYVILYGTGVFVSATTISFLAYMALMGTCGVLDHCGILLTLKVPFSGGKLRSVSHLYASNFHDAHHAKFNVNYAFPFPAMDVAHGTYFEETNKRGGKN